MSPAKGKKGSLESRLEQIGPLVEKLEQLTRTLQGSKYGTKR